MSTYFKKINNDDLCYSSKTGNDSFNGKTEVAFSNSVKAKMVIKYAESVPFCVIIKKNLQRWLAKYYSYTFNSRWPWSKQLVFVNCWYS